MGHTPGGFLIFQTFQNVNPPVNRIRNVLTRLELSILMDLTGYYFGF